MPVVVQDGYTLPLETKPETKDEITGAVSATGLPVVTGRYRPAVFGEMQAFRHAYQRADGPGQAKLVADMVAGHVVDWDAAELKNGTETTLPITPENVLRLPEPITNQLLDIVSTWAVAKQQGAGGN